LTCSWKKSQRFIWSFLIGVCDLPERYWGFAPGHHLLLSKKGGDAQGARSNDNATNVTYPRPVPVFFYVWQVGVSKTGIVISLKPLIPQHFAPFEIKTFELWVGLSAIFAGIKLFGHCVEIDSLTFRSQERCDDMRTCENMQRFTWLHQILRRSEMNIS
jgi:hypothetical protein